MRIGIISDTHLSSLTGDFITLVKERFSECDMVVHAGDFTSPEVYWYLNEQTSGNLMAVCGNMDPPELRKLLPERMIFEKSGIKFGLIHGWGGPHDLEQRIARRFSDEGVNCIIYGHSHNGVSHKRDDILFFNPGSPTDRYHAKMNSIGYVTIENGEIFGEIVPV
jgi:putative phosphoesterase